MSSHALPSLSPRPPKPQDFAFAGDWPGFFSAVRGKGPRETLTTALAKFDAEAKAAASASGGTGVPPVSISGGTGVPPVSISRGTGVPPVLRAVDLACGEGRDTLELLKRGWHVLAIEPIPEGLASLREQTPEDQLARLTTQQADFAAARWASGIDLLNCSFSLPFCPADQFDELWSRIETSIRPGGRFTGQLFGDRDSWGRCGRTIAHSRTRLNHLLEAFTLEELREDEKDDHDAQTPKHWHVFHIVAKRR
jgi:tellurite methyltransferase